MCSAVVMRQLGLSMTVVVATVLGSGQGRGLVEKDRVSLFLLIFFFLLQMIRTYL